MAIVICAVCGIEFESNGGNAKYCSNECRIKGTYQRRKDWEERTGFREKQRIAVSEYRKAQLRIADQEKNEAIRKQNEIEQREKDRKNSEKAKVLEERAKAGDKMAQIEIALKNGDSLTYWRLRKEMIIEEDEKFCRKSKILIGGIDAYAGDFEYQIVSMARETDV